MASDEVLELSDVDPPVWRIMVSGVVYGPYTLGQMRSFVQENRLTPASQAADGDGGAFLPAGQHPRLAKLFRDQDTAARPQAPPVGTLSNHLVVYRGDGEGRADVIDILNENGTFHEVMPGIFVLQSLTQTPRLRELVSAACGEDGRFMIVNADSGRLAWHGLGDDAAIAIRTVWSKPA